MQSLFADARFQRTIRLGGTFVLDCVCLHIGPIITVIVSCAFAYCKLSGLCLNNSLVLSNPGVLLRQPPSPFRHGNPALCGSCPLVTPYYCRLGDLLCFVFISAYCMFDLSLYYLFLQYFDTVGWVF